MSLEERTASLENALAILVRLAQDLDERLNIQLSWINQLGEAQANSEAKIAALADAQIQTEETMRDLAARTDATFARLAESQAHTDRRLDALIDIVREGRGGNSQG